ncbi:MAG: hypothetical protein J6S94_00620 [Bacteroidaceae bacterium]|nr:hypothetical protein [Bacteroidaceae bacterium]
MSHARGCAHSSQSCRQYRDGESAAKVRIVRLKSDGLIEKVSGFVENGWLKSKYRNTGRVIL